MITESRIREVMREQRMSFEQACAWLGKRGAEARKRKHHGATVVTAGMRTAKEYVEPPAGAWWMKDNF